MDYQTDSIISAIDKKDYFTPIGNQHAPKRIQMVNLVLEAYTKFLVITVESSNISYQMRKVNTITKNLLMLQGIPRKHGY